MEWLMTAWAATSLLEIAANLMTVLCIFLAGRNNIHTWWTGIIACTLFGVLFYQAKLYADVTLQVFFLITGFIGWMKWLNSQDKFNEPLPITNSDVPVLVKMSLIAIVVSIGYGALLHYFTDAFAPWIDSLVLTFSIVAQLLLVRKNIENWYVWVFVNTLSVPLYAVKGLYLTSGLYTLFLLNAIISIFVWKRMMKK